MPPILPAFADEIMELTMLRCMSLALLFRRDAARLGPEVRFELPMAGAGH